MYNDDGGDTGEDGDGENDNDGDGDGDGDNDDDRDEDCAGGDVGVGNNDRC